MANEVLQHFLPGYATCLVQATVHARFDSLSIRFEPEPERSANGYAGSPNHAKIATELWARYEPGHKFGHQRQSPTVPHISLIKLETPPKQAANSIAKQDAGHACLRVTHPISWFAMTNADLRNTRPATCTPASWGKTPRGAWETGQGIFAQHTGNALEWNATWSDSSSGVNCHSSSNADGDSNPRSTASVSSSRSQDAQSRSDDMSECDSWFASWEDWPVCSLPMFA